VEATDDDAIRAAMINLMTPDQSSFRSPHDIYRLFNDPTKVYSYKKLLSRIDALFRTWIGLVFDKPVLSDLYLDTTSTKNEVQARKRLVKARENLSHKGGPDPLPEAVIIAARARRPNRSAGDIENDDSDDENKEPKANDENKRKRRNSPAGRMYEKRRTATRLIFNDDNDEVEEDEDDDVLPDPKRPLAEASSVDGTPNRKFRRSQQKPYTGRRPWSDMEKKAISDGITQYGFGRWADIKAHYDTILKNRTSGQIKVSFISGFVGLRSRTVCLRFCIGHCNFFL
jgi:hypothetical protein